MHWWHFLRTRSFLHVSDNIQAIPSEVVNRVRVFRERDFPTLKRVLARPLVRQHSTKLELSGDDVFLSNRGFCFLDGVEHAAVLVLARVERVLD